MLKECRSLVVGVLALAALCAASVPAFALDPWDTPSVSCVSSGENKITVKLTAGPSGALAGFTLQWKKLSDYEANGWDDVGDLCRLSLSGQPSMQHPGKSRWDLGPNESEEITIGDINFDETGVSGQGCGLDPLDCGTDYIFRAFAHAGRRMGRSAWSANTVCTTLDCPREDCTRTQGYWKTHGPAGCVTGNNTNEWPVASLNLGNKNYTDLQLCSILNKPAQGNGLIILAHQLIAAKLNVALGAGCPGAAAAIAAADALIGNLVVPPVGGGSLHPSVTNALTKTLDDYNNGILAGCPSHCPAANFRKDGPETAAPTPADKSTWGRIKTIYR